MGGNRGKYLVQSHTDTSSFVFIQRGLPGIESDHAGLQFKNASFNGVPVSTGRRIRNDVTEDHGVFTTVSPTGDQKTDNGSYILFDAPVSREGQFDVDIRVNAGNAVSLTIFNRA